jgi:hypothetical protein
VTALRVGQRAAPGVALAVVVAALGARALGSPRWAALAFVAAGLVWLAGLAARAAWRLPVSDATARQLDADAALAGELRSARWFASAAGTSAWSRHHLASAAERARAISWRDVYPSPRAGRRWVVALGLVAVALAVGYWPSLDAASTGGAPAAIGADSETGALPPELVEELSALANGDLSPEQARELARTLLEREGLDPVLARQLESFLAQSGQQVTSPSDGPGQPNDQQQAGTGSQSGTETPDDVEWALGDTASRLANEQARRASPRSPAADAESVDADAPESGESTEGTGAARPPDDTSRRDTSDTGSVGGLAIETEEASGDDAQKGQGRSSAGSGRTPRGESFLADWALTEALNRELVQADDAARGRTIRVDERRRTEEGQSAVAFSRERPQQRIVPPVFGPAAIMPEARRRLIERYFVREAE